MPRWRFPFRYASALILIALTAATAAAWQDVQHRLRGYYRDVLARCDAAWGEPSVVTYDHQQSGLTNTVWQYRGQTYTLSAPVYTNIPMTNAWSTGTNVFTRDFLMQLDDLLLSVTPRYVDTTRLDSSGTFDTWFKRAYSNYVGYCYLTTNLNVRADLDANWRQVWAEKDSGYLGFHEVYVPGGIPPGDTPYPVPTYIITHPSDYPYLTPQEIARQTDCARVTFPKTNEWDIVYDGQFSWSEYDPSAFGGSPGESWLVWQAQSVPVIWQCLGYMSYLDMLPYTGPSMIRHDTNYLAVVRDSRRDFAESRPLWITHRQPEVPVKYITGGWLDLGGKLFPAVREAYSSYTNFSWMGYHSSTSPVPLEQLLSPSAVSSNFVPLNLFTAATSTNTMYIGRRSGSTSGDWQILLGGFLSVRFPTNLFTWSQLHGSAVPSRFFHGQRGDPYAPSKLYPTWNIANPADVAFERPEIQGHEFLRIEEDKGQVLFAASTGLPEQTNTTAWSAWVRVTNMVYSARPPTTNITLTLRYDTAPQIYTEPRYGWRGGVFSESLFDARDDYLACLTACTPPYGAWAYTNHWVSTNDSASAETDLGSAWSIAATNDLPSLAARLARVDAKAIEARGRINAALDGHAAEANAFLRGFEGGPAGPWLSADDYTSPYRLAWQDWLSGVSGAFAGGWIDDSMYGSSTHQDLLSGGPSYSGTTNPPVGIGWHGLGSFGSVKISIGTNSAYMDRGMSALVIWEYAGAVTGSVAVTGGNQAARTDQVITNWPAMLYGNTVSDVHLYGGIQYNGLASHTRTPYARAENPLVPRLPSWPAQEMPPHETAKIKAPVIMLDWGPDLGSTVMVTNDTTGDYRSIPLGSFWDWESEGYHLWLTPTSYQIEHYAPTNVCRCFSTSSPVIADGSFPDVPAQGRPRPWRADYYDYYGPPPSDIVYIRSESGIGGTPSKLYRIPSQMQHPCWNSTNFYRFNMGTTNHCADLLPDGTPTGSVTEAGQDGAINAVSNTWHGTVNGDGYYLASTNIVTLIQRWPPDGFYQISAVDIATGPTNSIPETLSLPVSWTYTAWNGDWVTWDWTGVGTIHEGRAIEKTVSGSLSGSGGGQARADWLPQPPLVFWQFTPIQEEQ